MNGAGAAMISVAVIIAIRTRVAPWQQMIPVAFATLAGSKLTPARHPGKRYRLRGSQGVRRRTDPLFWVGRCMSTARIATRAPGPSATACRRTTSGESTTSTCGSARCLSNACQVPCTSSWSRIVSRVPSGSRSSPPRSDGENHQIAVAGDHAGGRRLPDQRGARRDHDLGEAGGAIEQRLRYAGGLVVLPNCEVRISAASRPTGAGLPRTRGEVAISGCRNGPLPSPPNIATRLRSG